MNKLQIGVVSASIILFLVLLFAFSTKPPERAAIDKKRAVDASKFNEAAYIDEQKHELEAATMDVILLLEDSLRQASSDAMKLNYLKRLSSEWYALKEAPSAAMYAKEVATIENSVEAWSIAGTSLTIALQRSEEGDLRNHLADEAIAAYQNAISMEPENPQHRLNLAQVYITRPSQENPMQGVLMMRDLAEKYPTYVPVMLNLGRQGVRVGMNELAIGRLLKVIELEPNNKEALDLLSKAYKATGDNENSALYAKRLSELQ